MIISRGRRYIFVHIPKTGGTALSLALEARAMKDDVLIGDTPKARARRRRLDGVKARGRLWKHSTLADIEGLVAPEELADFFILTVVRNPWDRVVSYYHWLREQRFDHPAVALARRHDFTGFLSDPATLTSLRRSPYASYVTDSAGREHCRLFARFEDLERDLAVFEAHLGFALDLPSGINSSGRTRDYRGYFDEASAALVAEACREDIARFDYRF